MFVVAPYESWNENKDRARALALARDWTKEREKMAWVYEVEGDLCRPVLAYVRGKAYHLEGEPWRSCETQFEGKFPVGCSWTRGAAS